MKHLRTSKASIGFGAVLAVAVAFGAMGVQAEEKVLMAIPSFLTGGGAPAFGVPARNGAEVIIEAINKGKLPAPYNVAPYNTKGIGGAMIEAIYYDESGGNTKQVTEFRNKVQKQGVQVFVGYVSSGTCQALTPVAEQLKVLTVFAVCGTPRVFEDIDTNPKYVFRTMSHATADNVAAAHYVKAKVDGLTGYTGLNQNYAWGQDSWRDFDLSMKLLMPSVKPSSKLQWPKLFSGQYGAEISALLRSPEQIIHTSFWGGDLEAFIFQASARGLFKKKKVVLTVAGTAAYRLKKKLPEGLILGARGPYGLYAAKVKNPLNEWFQKTYRNRFGAPPFGGSYQYAQGILGVKIAYDKAAAANGGKFPSTDQVIKAFEYLEYESFATKVSMKLGKGHQAVTTAMYGKTKWDPETGEQTVVDVVTYQPECVMPPPDVNSVEWIKGGMKGAKC